MSTDATEQFTTQADRELEETVRASPRTTDPRRTLAQLLSAFDARRWEREKIALRACVPAVARL